MAAEDVEHGLLLEGDGDGDDGPSRDADGGASTQDDGAAPTKSGASSTMDDDRAATGGKGRLHYKLLIREVLPLARLAWPVVIAFLLQTSLNMAVIFAVGHASDDAAGLAAVALASMYCVVTGLAPIFGMATAADTLSSQAYGRDNKSPLVGIILQQCILILLLLAVPVTVLWANAEAILLLCGQDPEVARLAGLYCRLVIPGLPALVVFEAFKKYTQAQGMTHVTMLALAVGSGVLMLSCYVLIYALGLGFMGAPLSLALAWWTLALFTWAYVWRRGLHRNTWYGWSRAALHGWGKFLKLGLPGMFMLMNEWCAFEGVAIAAGILGQVELASQSVVLTTASLCYMLPFGVAIATSIRVGNLLGANQPWAARRVALVGTIMGISVSLFNSVLIVSLHSVWGQLFSEDPDVVHMVGQVLLIYAVFAIFDGGLALLSGILRGAGRQRIGAILNFVAFYFIALPLGFLLAFKADQSLFGLWWGLCVGLFFCNVSFMVIIYRFNWPLEAQRAQERATVEAAEADTLVRSRSLARFGLFRRKSSQAILLTTAPPEDTQDGDGDGDAPRLDEHHSTAAAGSALEMETFDSAQDGLRSPSAAGAI